MRFQGQVEGEPQVAQSSLRGSLTATGRIVQDRERPVSHATSFRVLALITTIAAYLEIVLGGTVRATESGLACPGWPLCGGRVIPIFDQHVLIEYSHRLSASAVSVLVIVLAVSAFTFFRQPRYLRILSAVAVGLLVLQVLLGGITVLLNLPPEFVTAHLANATILLGVLASISVYSFTGRKRPGDALSRRFSRVAMMAAGGVFLLILAGSYVVGSNSDLACHTWPLCNGQVIPMGGQRNIDINFLHRIVALLIGVAIAAVALRAWRTRRDQPVLLWAATGALALYLAQVLVGAGNVWFGLAAGIQIAHLATAEALWLLTAVLAVLAATLGSPQARQSARAERQRNLPVPSPDRRPRFGDRQPRDRSAAERK